MLYEKIRFPFICSTFIECYKFCATSRRKKYHTFGYLQYVARLPFKRAPYGEQLPKTDIIKGMVVAQDSFVPKLNKVFAGFVRKSFADI